MITTPRLWYLSITVGAACTACNSAWAASTPDTNATSEELSLWYVVMAASAVLFLIVFWRRRQGLFGLLGALFLLGTSARLWLTLPLWFPRLEISTGALENQLMLAVLTVQAVLTVFVLMRNRISAVSQGVLVRFSTGRIALLIVLIALFSVSATVYVAYGNYGSYALQIGVGGALSIVQIATLVALFAVIGPDQVPRLPVGGLALFAALASAVLAWTAFDRVPHVQDELGYIFQARIFAAGALWSPAPPVEAQAAFEYYLLDIRGDRWLSVLAPGWSVLLTIGVLAGVPWLINPVLTGISVVLAHGIVRRAISVERANIVALLMATSPWVLATGASLMTHSTALLMMLLGWWCLLRANGGSAWRDRMLASCAGLAMGWVFVTRPLDGVVVGGLTGLWLLRRLPSGASQIVAYALGCIVAGSVFLAFNYATTGDFLLTPQADYLSRLWGESGNAFGFGANIGPPEKSWGTLDIWMGHSPLEAALNVLNGLVALNFELLGWTFGSLVPIWAMLLWHRRLTGFDRTMIVVFITVVAALSLYWFVGAFYIGPRYWYITLLPVLTLAAAGVEEIAYRLPEQYRGRFGCVILLLCATSVVSFTPWRGVAKYHGYGGYTDDIRRQAEAQDWGNALVFVSTEGDVGSALYLNDPFLSPGHPIFVRDLGPDGNAATIAAFPGREVIYISD